MLVSVNQGMATISGDFLIVALLVYSLAVVAFAGDFAFGAAAPGRRQRRREGGAAAVLGHGRRRERSRAEAGRGRAMRPAPPTSMPPARLFRLAVHQRGRQLGPRRGGLSVLGASAHVVAVVTRGLAVHRAPWGNMYEFITALTCVAAIFFGYVVVRYRAWALGVFVMGAVVLALGLAETLIYTPAGPLVPALQSYWLSIHVTAMTLATGIFFVAAVLGIMYLVAERYRARVAAGKVKPGNGLIDRIPSADAARQADLPDGRLRLPGLDLRRHRRRDLGGPGVGPLLGLGPGGDLGVHHLGDLRRLPARPGHGRLARRPRALHPAARLRQPDHQHARRAGLHHRHALLRRRELSPARDSGRAARCRARGFAGRTPLRACRASAGAVDRSVTPRISGCIRKFPTFAKCWADWPLQLTRAGL